jgi:pyruvate/2-oxoglutarate dehydrogenase complex dihydrolipoamide acyltransferase (E2) component
MTPPAKPVIGYEAESLEAHEAAATAATAAAEAAGAAAGAARTAVIASTDVVRRLDDMKEDLGEIKTDVKTTNGRVRKLEIWKGELRGAARAVGWIPPLITASVAAGLSFALYAIFAAH